MPRVLSFIALAGVIFLPRPLIAQVVVGQKDTFQDGTTDGWSQGLSATTPPANIPTGGPSGAGDAFMQLTSHGGFGADSKLVVFNDLQWAGGKTYSPAITGIGMDFENLGATPLTMRLAFRDTAFSTYSTTTAVTVPADATWHHALFSLLDSNVTPLGGTQPFSAALATGIQEMRILEAAAPSFNGDSIAAVVGVDNITAVGAVPEPGSLGLMATAGIAAAAWRRAKAARRTPVQ